MPELMQHLQPMFKDLSEQTPGPYVIVGLSSTGNGYAIYADDFHVEDGYLTALREVTDEGKEPTVYPVFAAPQTDVKVFHISVIALKTWETAEREGSAEVKARHKLQNDLQPEKMPVFVPGMGIMPKDQAEALGPAVQAMLKDREGVPAGQGTYR